MKKDDVFPPQLEKFSRYFKVILNRSDKTIFQYQNDIMIFLRFEYALKNHIDYKKNDITELDVSAIDDKFLASITQADVMEFLMYTSSVMANDTKARARKLSSIRSFFKFLINQEHIISENPATNIQSPSIKPALPKFLNEEESIKLLKTVENDSENKFRVRDYAIITIFLNCGIRLSELVGIDISDMDGELRSMRVLGKGAKERMIYLNDACRSAIFEYLKIRSADEQITDLNSKKALFISKQHRRISNQMVQTLVYKYLDKAGLGNRGLSVHKLRHTAATLMYQSGEVDLRVLKDILGHEQLTTTQIYTHVSDEKMEKAMAANPLSSIKSAEKDNKE